MAKTPIVVSTGISWHLSKDPSTKGIALLLTTDSEALMVRFLFTPTALEMLCRDIIDELKKGV